MCKSVSQREEVESKFKSREEIRGIWLLNELIKGGILKRVHFDFGFNTP